MTQENVTPSGSPTVITQILVPTDLSAFSEQVLDYALELAKALGARIRLFHAAVQPDYEVPFLVSPGMRGAAAALVEKAAEVSAHIRTELEAICKLDWEAACLQSHRAERAVRTASSAQVRQPLRRSTASTAAYGDNLADFRRR